jgi:hypothetical protein
MKTKSLKEYLEKRLNKQEIEEVEKAAKIEYGALKMLQEDVSREVIRFMAKKKIGFNDLVVLTGKSPAQISKILKGEANLTLATVAQIFAIMGRKVHLVAV